MKQVQLESLRTAAKSIPINAKMSWLITLSALCSRKDMQTNTGDVYEIDF